VAQLRLWFFSVLLKCQSPALAGVRKLPQQFGIGEVIDKTNV
jgi:hypothetical protein